MTAPTLPADYTVPERLLADRVILVTGAGGGLGQACARAAAAAGATVVLAGRTISKLESTYDEIVAAGGPEPAIYPINFSGAGFKDYVELATTLRESLGGLDGIVHAAVHFKGFFPMDAVEPADWIENLQVNLTAPWALTRACLPLLRSSTESSVVFVGDQAHAYYGAYGIAKAGLLEMMRIWAQEGGDNPRPRMNLLQPGAMRTGLRSKGFPGETASESTPPEQIAPAVLWLLGADSAPLHGEEVRR